MHQIPIWLCADWILLAKIMLWIVMIWNFSELRTIWFLPNAWTWIVVVHSGSDHKLLHIRKPNNEHFEWFIFISILFLSSGRFSSRFFFVSFKRRDEDEKKIAEYSNRMLCDFVVYYHHGLNHRGSLYCFSVLLFNFHFTIISFSFSFENENRRSTIYFVCSEFGAKCFSLCRWSVFFFRSSSLARSILVHVGSAFVCKEPVIEKVRKHCFSDKGIALSTRMIYLVNISIQFSYEVELYHMCLESTWIRA